MKGQMYLILAIIIVTILVVMRISINIGDILESNRHIESNLNNLELQNMKKEITQALINSYSLSNRSENINHFIDFVRSSELDRGNKISGISVQSDYPNVTDSSTITMNTSVHNFLGSQIENLTLVWSFDSSSKSFSNVPDNSTQHNITFDFNMASDANYTLSVNYTVSNSTTSKSISIPVEIGNSKFIGFYIVSFSVDQDTLTREFTNTAILNQTQST